MEKLYKTVLLPIKVCTGDYCWDGYEHICKYFGHCILEPAFLKSDKEGRYPKPKKCSELKEKETVSDYVTTEVFGPFIKVEEEDEK